MCLAARRRASSNATEPRDPRGEIEHGSCLQRSVDDVERALEQGLRYC